VLDVQSKPTDDVVAEVAQRVQPDRWTRWSVKPATVLRAKDTLEQLRLGPILDTLADRIDPPRNRRCRSRTSCSSS
jgi:hypothetical protein